MRTIAWETAFQIALRDCSKKLGGGANIYVLLVKGVHAIKHTSFAEGLCYSQGTDVTMKDFDAFLDMRRCKNWAPKIISRKCLSI